MDEVRRIPGTFGDPVRVIQNLPGAARFLGTGLLVIRGANPEDSGVYVDGIKSRSSTISVDTAGHQCGWSNPSTTCPAGTGLPTGEARAASST